MAGPDHKLTVHRGDKTSPVIATTGGLCPTEKGVTEVFLEEDSNPIVLEHIHHETFHIHGKTLFTYKGKKYHWKGHTGLVDDETDTLLAIFHSSWFDLNWNKVGRLEITSEGKKLLNIAVITALIVQERSDEGKQAVCPPILSWTDGNRGSWLGKKLMRRVFPFFGDLQFVWLVVPPHVINHPECSQSQKRTYT